MNIGLIGSGGREHALCLKISKSKLVKKIFCFPGNAGTAEIAKNIEVDVLNFKKLLQFIKFYKVDLVVIGPEEPLTKGLVDYLEKNKIKVFGPNKISSKLEGSKAFMKKLCKKYKIPTANYKICTNKNQVLQFLKENRFPLVVKADGLAAGKGVSICKTKKSLLKISNEIFKGKFKSSKKLVLEEFLQGEEASYFIVADKNNFKFFGSAQDHKRVRENDLGPNTGGMGAYSPAPIINKDVEKKIIEKIIKPTLLSFKKIKKEYKGFLYIGLMIKNNEPHLIEFNVRMGDPECQVILPRLKTDIVEIMLNTVNNRLGNSKIIWNKFKSMTIVLCSKGYPGKYKKFSKLNKIKNLPLDKKITIYHAGTKLLSGNIFSVGGRVLNITSIGNNFLSIRKKILKFIKKLNWKDGFFRKDIGWRVINNNANN